MIISKGQLGSWYSLSTLWCNLPCSATEPWVWKMAGCRMFLKNAISVSTQPLFPNSWAESFLIPNFIISFLFFNLNCWEKNESWGLIATIFHIFKWIKGKKYKFYFNHTLIHEYAILSVLRCEPDTFRKEVHPPVMEKEAKTFFNSFSSECYCSLLKSLKGILVEIIVWVITCLVCDLCDSVKVSPDEVS